MDNFYRLRKLFGLTTPQEDHIKKHNLARGLAERQRILIESTPLSNQELIRRINEDPQNKIIYKTILYDRYLENHNLPSRYGL